MGHAFPLWSQRLFNQLFLHVRVLVVDSSGSEMWVWPEGCTSDDRFDDRCDDRCDFVICLFVIPEKAYYNQLSLLASHPSRLPASQESQL